MSRKSASLSREHLFRVLTADLRHMTAAWDDADARVLLKALPRIIVGGRFRALLYFRLAQASPTGLSAYLQQRALRAGACDLHPDSRIGPGLCLMHSTGIVVGHEVVAGRELVLYQNVTLGHGMGAVGQPRLGDQVRIYAGAVVLGAITVGSGAVIGANAVVLKDVAAGQTVVGVWK